jgi:uncharacterized membrane protein
MTKLNVIVSTALVSLIALSAVPNSSLAATVATEKCYGIAKAGQNDCSGNGLSCGSNAKKDRDPNAFLNLPKGLCEKIVGGHLKPNEQK